MSRPAGGLDLFRFTDAPILEQLHQYRTEISGLGRLENQARTWT
jgi:hypothetical protein